MLFTKLIFFLFFAVVLVAYWSAPWHRARKVFLLAASYYFYAAWDVRFCSLIAISTLIDFWAGGQIHAAQSTARRRAFLIVSLCANLGLLGFFKYFNFFVESMSALFVELGFGASTSTLNIVLPVGISFFTFQSMSYTIDIYRGKLEPRRGWGGLLDFALFVAFFPQLVAGPIVRATHFLPQLDAPRTPDRLRFRSGAGLFLIGFIKKVAVSDNIAPIVESVFADPGSFTAASQVLGAFLYGVQIYCDFAGYSDMAIGAAKMLGYDLTLNFDAPYSARNITDFWRRWHISLSTWLRDYLYISLGGSRCSAMRTRVNLMATMLLGGLWHGAAFNFVIWGGLHGIALIAHKAWMALTNRGGEERPPSLPGTILSRALTLYWVALAWVYFRAPGWVEALDMTRAFVTLQSEGTRSISALWLLVLLLIAIEHTLVRKREWFRRLDAVPDWLYAIGIGAVFGLMLPLAPLARTPFIYFQF